jgi:hypothetical protein
MIVVVRAVQLTVMGFAVKLISAVIHGGIVDVSELAYRLLLWAGGGLAIGFIEYRRMIRRDRGRASDNR